MNWMLALPEIVLAIAGLAILAGGVIPKRDTTFPATLAVLGAFLLVAVLLLAQADGTAFPRPVRGGRLHPLHEASHPGRGSACAAAGAGWNRAEGIAKFEYPVLVLFATLGMLVMISAGDLISLYLGLELLSLPLYILAAFHRDDHRSAEAGLKYFVLGALSSGLLLYGMSWVYGFSGSTQFAAIAAALDGGVDAAPGVVIGMVFIAAGLTFKVAAVPFHMWTPDVYEGAPTSVVAFFATATKVGAIAVIVRVLAGPFGGLAEQWQQIVFLTSAASMLLGAFAAIRQENIKRLFAYSWISHTGFVMMGLVCGTEAGLRGVLL